MRGEKKMSERGRAEKAKKGSKKDKNSKLGTTPKEAKKSNT
jgi:hypothetical protein